MARSLVPLTVAGPKREWGAPGTMFKPQYCKNCRYQKTGFGFCPDYYKTGAQAAILLGSPNSSDVNDQRPLSGPMGWWIRKNFIDPAGLDFDRIIVGHVIRCKVPFYGTRKAYPTGDLKHHCERTCRKYDSQHGEKGRMVTGGIATFDPNCILLCFDPGDARTTTAYHRQIQAAFSRLKRLSDAGYRVLMCCGKEAAEFFAPHIVGAGGLNKWHGDWFECEFPKLMMDVGTQTIEGFKPA